MIVAYIGLVITQLILIIKRIIEMQDAIFMQLVKHLLQHIYHILIPKIISSHIKFSRNLLKLFPIYNIMMVFQEQANIKSWINMKMLQILKEKKSSNKYSNKCFKYNILLILITPFFNALLKPNAKYQMMLAMIFI